MKLPTTCPHCMVSLETDDLLAYFSKLYKDPKEAEQMAHVYDAIIHKGEKLNRLEAIYDWEKDRTDHFECPDCHGRIERNDE